MGWIRPKPGTAAEAHPAKIYLELREAALHMSADAAGRTKDDNVDEPYAVVTDLGAERGSATILATIGGAASIYFSNGGGAIGGEVTAQWLNSEVKTRPLLAKAGRYEHLRLSDAY